MLLWLADVPGKQVADAIDGVVGDAGEHVAEPGFWIEAVELGGLDQGIEGGGTITASVGPGKKVVFPAEGNRAVILPMSGRKSKFVTAGTHSTGAVFGASMPSGGPAVMSFTSRSRPAWSSLWRHGCWILPPAPGWGSGCRAWRHRRWSTCIS